TGSPSAAYIANASAAIRGAAPGTRVVAGQVPPDIGYYARTSSVIGDMVPGKLDWVSKPTGTLDGLQMFGPDGRLYPAWVQGASSGPATPHKCWPARNGRIVIRFWQSPPYLATALRIGYLW